MLTFEWDKELEQLEIHGDEKGLRDLVTQLTNLVKYNSEDHLHMMTKDWGGKELSSDKQSSKSELINHVKVFKWEDEE